MGCVLSSGSFEQEPDAPLGLIDPIFEKTDGGYVSGVIAEAVDGTHAQDQSFFVLAEFGEHVGSVDEVGVVVGDALEAGDVSDGTDGGAADFADAFGDVVGHGEELVSVVVEEEMIIAEVRAAHMPVEVFGFEIQGENVGEQGVERAG